MEWIVFRILKQLASIVENIAGAQQLKLFNMCASNNFKRCTFWNCYLNKCFVILLLCNRYPSKFSSERGTHNLWLYEARSEVIITILDAANDDDVDLSKICPPACTETKYSSSISTVPKENSKGESKVYVFFTDSSIVKFKRSGLYKITDIICKYNSCFH